MAPEVNPISFEDLIENLNQQQTHQNAAKANKKFVWSIGILSFLIGMGVCYFIMLEHYEKKNQNCSPIHNG